MLLLAPCGRSAAINTQVMKPVRKTNNDHGLPVIRTDEKVLGDKNIPNLPFKY